MIEIGEAAVLAKQIKEALLEKIIKEVIVAKSPHKNAWFFEPVDEHVKLLNRNKIIDARFQGGMIEIMLQEEVAIVLGEGVQIRYHKKCEMIPEKHQLALVFEDESALSIRIGMYGWVFFGKKTDMKQANVYYEWSCDRANVLSKDFTYSYFYEKICQPNGKKSLKETMATKQRIPGLGNGTFQDVCFETKLNPKAKISSLSVHDLERLYEATIRVVSDIIKKGGRNSEFDLYGKVGGFVSKLSDVNNNCPNCGGQITIENYLGGKIRFCTVCQK